MLFQTTAAHEELRAKIRSFAEEEIKPLAFMMDQNNEFPEEAVKKLGKLGWMGIPFPKEYGGAGLDALSYAIAVEELARVGGGFHYEIICGIGKRVPRVYLRDGKAIGQKDYFNDIYEGFGYM